MSTTTAAHLAPTACYICGGEAHPAGDHTYWSNADADRAFATEPAAAYDPAAAYVAEHRPY